MREAAPVRVTVNLVAVAASLLLAGACGPHAAPTADDDGEDAANSSPLDGAGGTDGALRDGAGPDGALVDAAGPAPDASTAECVIDGDCGAGRGCLAGICRDRCTLGIWCGTSTTGEYCEAGLCVECQSQDDCAGTRYACSPTARVCEETTFDPTFTKIGVFYHTWHCPAADQLHDLTQILAGNAPYGPYNASHWWGRPAEGYYCLSRNDALLARHATQLRDMGVDFVFVDVTNHAYNSNALNDRPVEMIIQPFTRMVAVWSGIPGAPRIVPWVPVVRADAAHPRDKHMVYTLLDLLNAHPGLQWVYEGKPLILVTENDSYPVDVARWNELSANYTLRKMWANAPSDATKWSYMERCQESPLNAAACDQRMAFKNSAIEQLPIATAYQADYMSHPASATPKHQGKTFRKQFETLFDNPTARIATITGWNEWNVGRLQCDHAPLCVCSHPEDVNGCFLDQYNIEYNRDLEPAANAMGDYYYRLAKGCIALFRSGARCDAAHTNDICCKDY